MRKILVGLIFLNSITIACAEPDVVKPCIGCHGTVGKNGKAGVPQLKGRSYEDLVRSMKSLRETPYPEPQMLHTMTNEEINQVADYFSNVR